MSEFSKSFHLRTRKRADAIALLERASVTGFSLEAKGPWISIIRARADSPKEHMLNALVASGHDPTSLGDVSQEARAEFVARYLAASVREQEGQLRARFLDGRDETSALLAANRGLLLIYQFASDHGCSVDVYDGQTRVAGLSASFESEDHSFDRNTFVRLRLLSAAYADQLARWVEHAHEPSERKRWLTHIVGDKLRLPRYAWVS